MLRYFPKWLMILILGVVIQLAYAEQAPHATNPFLGTWKLVSVTRDTTPPGNKTNSFGEHPTGYLTYGSDGRMMVIIVQDPRPIPKGKTITTSEAEALFRSMNSYAGTYTILADRIIHHVDISWNQKWTGTDQIRYFKFQGSNQLILSMPPIYDSSTGKRTVDSLTWQRVS